MRTVLMISLLLVVACGRQQQQPASNAAAPQSVAAANLTPEQLGELGARIKKEPARADELLSQHGLTHESFEKAIRDVTEDAAASKRYAASYRRLGGA